jgi:hypothetical protein
MKILSCIQEGIQQKLCQPQNAEKYWLSARFIYLKINRLVSANKSRRRGWRCGLLVFFCAEIVR